jgi:predicted transcriptional regulator
VRIVNIIIIGMCMHVHVRNITMRTTIEMKDEHRARLLELAARRGEKGFSGIVAEAIDKYLNEQGANTKQLQKALLTRGKFSGKEANQFRSKTVVLRQLWRSS